MYDDYGTQAVKDVIARFPAVGEILARYGIGCAPCTSGTCLLKDVVGLHGLARDKEMALHEEIGRVLAAR